MLVIPLQAVPAQSLNVTLGQQACKIMVYQKGASVYLDLYVAGNLVVAGILCHNDNRLVRAAYLGFAGDLAFNDTQGAEDPAYAGLGSRWVLLYLGA